MENATCLLWYFRYLSIFFENNIAGKILDKIYPKKTNNRTENSRLHETVLHDTLPFQNKMERCPQILSFTGNVNCILHLSIFQFLSDLFTFTLGFLNRKMLWEYISTRITAWSIK